MFGRSGDGAGDAEGPYLFSNSGEFADRDFDQFVGWCFTVDCVDHHLFWGDLTDQIEPGRNLFRCGIIDRLSVEAATQEHRLDDQLSVKAFHQLDGFGDWTVSARLVDDAHGPVDSRVEFQNIVVHTAKRAADRVAIDHRGIAQYRYFGFGAQFVAGGEGIGDDLFELGVHGGLSVSGEGDHIREFSIGSHLLEFGSQMILYLFASIESRGDCFVSPSAFAIDAIEVAEFVVEGKQVDSQRQTESPAVYRAEDDMVEENCTHNAVCLVGADRCLPGHQVVPRKRECSAGIRYIEEARGEIEALSCFRESGVRKAAASRSGGHRCRHVPSVRGEFPVRRCGRVRSQ